MGSSRGSEAVLDTEDGTARAAVSFDAALTGLRLFNALTSGKGLVRDTSATDEDRRRPRELPQQGG
jgi:hypothetical protein